MNLKIYRDTNTLPGNIGDENELAAIKELERLGMTTMFGSHIVRYEAMNTENESKRQQLVAEYDALKPVPKDEKLLGFNAATKEVVPVSRTARRLGVGV